jgi:hypothetical protein
MRRVSPDLPKVMQHTIHTTASSGYARNAYVCRRALESDPNSQFIHSVSNASCNQPDLHIF